MPVQGIMEAGKIQICGSISHIFIHNIFILKPFIFIIFFLVSNIMNSEYYGNIKCHVLYVKCNKSIGPMIVNAFYVSTIL